MNEKSDVMEAIERYRLLLGEQGEEAALDYFGVCGINGRRHSR